MFGHHKLPLQDLAIEWDRGVFPPTHYRIKRGDWYREVPFPITVEPLPGGAYLLTLNTGDYIYHGRATPPEAAR